MILLLISLKNWKQASVFYICEYLDFLYIQVDLTVPSILTGDTPLSLAIVEVIEIVEFVLDLDQKSL